MHFEPVDHPPLMLSGLWPASRKRWEAEGLPEGADLYEYFGIEPFTRTPVPIETVFHPPFEERIVESNREFTIKINRRGVTEKNFHDATSMPEFIDYPIKSPADARWLREKLDPTAPGRIAPDWLEEAKRARRDRKLVFTNGGMYFGFLNEHMGTEKLMLVYFDSPEFIHEVNELLCTLCELSLDTILPKFKLDFVGYHEDMAFKTSSLISPEMFREFMTPYYRRVTAIARTHGVDIHFMDSDGHITDLIPLWLETGINLVSPIEVAAGMDVVQLRAEYGQDLLMCGGFDKRILADGKDAISREIERLRPVIEQGGYIPDCDHSVPPDVAFENYCHYVNCLKGLYGMH